MRYLTAIFLLVQMTVFAQSDVSSDHGSKFYGGLNTSIDLPYRRVRSFNELEQTFTVLKNIRNAEGPMSSYSSTLLIGRIFTSSIAVEVGITYAVRNFSINWSKVSFVRPAQSPWPELEPVVLEDDWQMRHILMPVRGIFMFGQGGVRSVSTIGAAVSLFGLGKAWPLAPYLGSALGLELQRPNIAATISTGAAIDIGRTGQLRIEPSFSYGLSPFTKHVVRSYLYTVGMNVGYFVQF
jgi:hypothetical protein